MADQLTLSQPEGTNYAHLITTGTPGFSDLPTALYMQLRFRKKFSRLSYENIGDLSERFPRGPIVSELSKPELKITWVFHFMMP